MTDDRNSGQPAAGTTTVSNPAPQPVLDPLSAAAIFLTVTVNPGGEQTVHDVLSDLSGLVRAIGFRDPGQGLSLVLAIGSDLWDRLFTGARPAELRPFTELRGERHVAPATAGDLLFHIRAAGIDRCFELAKRITSAMGEAITVVDEVHGFRYFDNRDLLGFVDGTENPVGPEAAAVSLVGAEDPDFAGGSYVHVQKYLHDMPRWSALTVGEQEKVIGRTKLDDIEFADSDKPRNSHLALNVVEDENGNQLEILRRNTPFGRMDDAEFGTYFIAYSRTPTTTERLLHNMFIGSPPGNTDRILDFSTAVTGGLYFAPPAGFLDDPPELPGR